MRVEKKAPNEIKVHEKSWQPSGDELMACSAKYGPERVFFYENLLADMFLSSFFLLLLCDCFGRARLPVLQGLAER